MVHYKAKPISKKELSRLARDYGKKAFKIYINKNTGLATVNL